MAKLEPADDAFLASAPKIYRETFEIPRPAQQVWEELVADGTLNWGRMLGRGGQWTSPQPYGVGTTRTMKAAFGAIVLHEKFFRWEEGKRYSFYVERANLPLFKRFAEDYTLEETGPSSCRLTWIIACETT